MFIYVKAVRENPEYLFLNESRCRELFSSQIYYSFLWVPREDKQSRTGSQSAYCWSFINFTTTDGWEKTSQFPIRTALILKFILCVRSIRSYSTVRNIISHNAMQTYYQLISQLISFVTHCLIKLPRINTFLTQTSIQIQNSKKKKIVTC